MALRKLKTKAFQPLTAKSASVSQKTSPNRPNSSFNIQQSIEKLENLDFLMQNKPTQKVSVLKELQILERNLDCSEINSIGATFSSQQIFGVYFSFLENLVKILLIRDTKLSNLVNRGVKGLEKAFKRIFYEFQVQVNEKESRVLGPLKRTTAVQTEVWEIQEERKCMTPEYENFKELPKVLEKIELSRVSSQLSEIYEELKMLLTDIPDETSIVGIKAPHSYQPLKSEEAKKIIINELQEIKDSIEIFIKKKRLKALQLHKEIQTDKEPKNPTWLALEALNEEKELGLLRLRGKLEILVSEKKKLEERLIQSNNRCCDLEDKVTLLERDCMELRHLNEGFVSKVKTLEKRILELGAMLKKLISFSEFQRNLKESFKGLGNNNKLVFDKNETFTREKKNRRPSGYLRAAETGHGNEKGQRLSIGGFDDEDSLKSFREKLVIEIEKIENSETIITQEKNEAAPGRISKFPEIKSNFVKNKEGKYIKAEIANTNSIEVKRNKKTTQESSTSSDPIQSFDPETLNNQLKLLLEEASPEVLPDLSDKQMKNLLGNDIVRLLKSDGKEKALPEQENPSNSLQTTENSFKPNLQNPPNNKSSSSEDSKISSDENDSESDSESSSSEVKGQKNSTKNLENPKITPKKNHLKPSNPFSMKIPEKKSRRSKILEKIESFRQPPNILINSRSPVVSIQGKKQPVQEKTEKTKPPHFSYNPSMSSSFSINPSAEVGSDEDFNNEESDFSHSQAGGSLNIPNFNSIRSFSRPASRSSNFSLSRVSLDMSLSEENKESLDDLQNQMKDLENQLKSSLETNQAGLFQALLEKQEEIKHLKLSYLSKSSQCDLAGLTQNDLLTHLRCKEKYQQLLNSLFENPSDINSLPSKARRELAVSVKGHDPKKCTKICDHLKRALKVVQRFRGKLYPLKLIKL